MKSGEAAVDQEDKIVVPPRKEPEERKEKALKEIEMRNAAYKATVLSDLLGKWLSLNVIMFDCCEESILPVQNYFCCLQAVFWEQNGLDSGFSFDVSKTRCSSFTFEKVMKINNNQSFIDFKCYDV
ncbi:hypothetical protein HID58_046672 [Brassica napus]|uniref:Uncharacterized protein n=1 Tax=Brassica napus TaxID=3708 RepID=A0ABQ8AX75_BRANA|nr:hypothetical protein HID58_046672 [Brassica napus]